MKEQFTEKMHRLFDPQGHRYNPITLSFQVTEGCILNCSYCYQHHKSDKRMSFETAKILIDELLTNSPKTKGYVDTYDSTCLVVDFIGGEPFLEIDLIDMITDYLIHKMIELKHPWATKYHINITTNGLLYFQPKVQEYIKKNKRNLLLCITIDGNKKLHDSCRVDFNGNGSYDKAVAALKHYKTYWHGFCSSKLTLAPQNIEYAYEALKEMVDSGYYDDLNFNTVFEEGWTLDHAKIYYNQLKMLADYLVDTDQLLKYTPNELNPLFGHPMDARENNPWCGGTNSYMIALDWKGNIFPCIRYMESSLNGEQEPYIIGNIHDGIMNNACTRCRVECLNRVTRRSESNDKCYNCPIAKGCASCSGYAYEVNGTPNSRTTYHCDMVKSRTLALCYLWNTYYRKKGISKRYKLDCPKDWALEIIDESEYDMLLSLSKE